MSTSIPSFTPLLQGQSAILYQVAPGKPNPQERAVKEGEFRGRVVQTEMKGGVNWYYTLNFLRSRIGKVHSEELKSERETELFFSKYRKKLTEFYCQMPSVCNQLEHPSVKTMFRALTQEKCQEMLTHWDSSILGVVDSMSAPLEQGYVGVKAVCELFAHHANGYNNFYDFLANFYFSHDPNIGDLFAQLQLDPKQWYQDKFSQVLNEVPQWETLQKNVKHAYSKAMLILSAAEKYGLKIANWRPWDPIENLITSLKEHGPHYISGALGSRIYLEPPFCLKNGIGGRKIYGWKPGTPKQERENFGTSVLIVGAQKLGETELVYFIDSEDPSDPNDKEKQKIYVVSYKTMRESISDLYGNFGFETPLPYAIHK